MDDQDKPLENLFRDKAETFSDLSYREEDWNNLEKRLDQLDLKKGYRRRIAILAAASVLLVGLMGYFTLSNHQKINEISEQVDQLEETRKRNEAAESDEIIDGEKPESGFTLAERGENDRGITMEAGTETENDANLEKQTPVSGQNEGQSSEISDIYEKRGAIERSNREFLAGSTLLRGSLEPLMKSEVHDVRVMSVDRASVVHTPVAFADGESRTGSVGTGMDSPTRSSVALGFMFSPDLSTAGGISNFDNPGFKGGVLAEYSFSKRFSLRSGAILSNVRYKAGQNDYRAPENWNYGVSPEETSALCLILDIPVTLKARMIQLERSNFYVTGGVSTYVMLSEKYTFDYGANTSPYLTSGWEGKTGDKFWASNLSFSIGYEMDISDRVALRAEPHLYVPLKEVGWGNVKLYSIGTSVSLNVRM